MTSDKDRLANTLNDPKRDTQLIATEPFTPLVLIGFLTGTISPTTAILTIECLVPPPAQGTAILRVAIARQHCSELSEALKRVAVQTHNPKAAKN